MKERIDPVPLSEVIGKPGPLMTPPVVVTDEKMSQFWLDHFEDYYEKAYQRARRQIARRDWIANHVPVIGPLLFRYWLWRTR